MSFTLDLAACSEAASALGDVEFVSAPPPLVRFIEPVGMSFWAMYDALDDDVDTNQQKKSANDKSPGKSSQQQQHANSQQPNKNQKVVVLTEEEYEVDWYDLLKLASGEAATQDEIKQAYRRRCLETHPDKQPDKSDELFKKVQRAFEILGDPDAKRSFDSSRPFDDTIPGESLGAKEDFYQSFSPVFERNKRWSTLPNPPSLGDDTTDLSQVHKFYDFWLQFRSWRDFSHMTDELEKIDDSMQRYEKRFYQQENQRILNRLRKTEAQRVRNLVERAQKNDPRLRRHAEAQEREREEIKRKKAEEIRLRQEKEAQKKQDEEDRIRREEEAKKQAAIDLKNAIVSAKKETTSYLESVGVFVNDASKALHDDKVKSANLTWFFANANQDEAKALETSTKAEKDSAKAVAVFNAKLQELERRMRKTRYGQPVAAEASPAKTEEKPTAKAVEAVEWEKADVDLLAKAIQKFPGGTVDRWRRIATVLRNKFTEEQVLVKTKELETALRRKQEGHVDPAPATDAEAPKAAAAAPAAAATPVESVEDWTPKQQSQLENGLRTLKDYKEKDKFVKIAAGVEGKTSKQCFERFKFLCNVNKGGKK